MRIFLSIIFNAIFLFSVAQEKQSGYFTLPKDVSSSDYVPGVVWVKLKESHRTLFSSSNRNRPLHPSITSTIPLIPIETVNMARARQAPRISVSPIDLSLYHKVFFDGGDIEAFINQLYATNVIELAEPEFRHKIDFVPDDPQKANQYYLGLIKAFEAWDVSKSSEDIVIGIIDSGGDLNHPDLASKLFINEAELNGLPGVDDDGNGFIDDINGWDFSGAQASLINTPGFIGDNDPSIVVGGNHSHGTWAAGCAAAATDNGIGIAGVGFNAKLLFTKHYADDQPTDDRFYTSNLYLGIVYAASMGAKVINCSFGSSFRSQINQDIITAVTLDFGSLVVASAGNENSETPNYPASYDYVLSVAATNQSDQKSSFSSYGFKVDISAPGSSIHTTSYDDTYLAVNGTSFSAPIVSGAAALLWSHFPDYSAVQIGEQLRVTADESIYQVNSTSFRNKLGKGRLDIFRALTDEVPSIRSSNAQLFNANGTVPEPGQTAFLTLDFTNFLKPSSSGLQATLSSSNVLVTVVNGTANLGVINTNETISNIASPFEISLRVTIPQNFTVNLTLTYTDGTYTDYEVIPVTLNPTFINITENLISSSVSSLGRIGFENSNQTNGLGFIFNDNQMLFEMGIIMGTSPSAIQNNVRGASQGVVDQDFVVDEKIKQIKPGDRSTSEVFGKFKTDVGNPSTTVNYRSLVWGSEPYEKFIFLEYTIKNTSTEPIENFYFGLFADWDISENGSKDRVETVNDPDGRIKMGYVYPVTNTLLPLAGIQFLNPSKQSFHYAIENNQDIAGPLGSFGLYDGFADQEKFRALSENRNQAGTTEAEGTDVSHVVSTGPYSIQPAEELTIAFALHGALNLNDLVTSARYADTLYNFTFLANQPDVSPVEICYGSSATLNATGATQFNWYSEFTGGTPVFSGASFTTQDLFNDTLFYVSNADNSYESIRTPALVKVKANPKIIPLGSTTICDGQTLILSVAEADEYEWSTGETTQTINVGSAGDYHVTVRDLSLSCEAQSQPISIFVNPSPQAAFSSGNSFTTNVPINFIDESAGAVAWLWDFGDGKSSTLQNPLHTYTQSGDYTVTLTVSAANGCTNSKSNPLDIITSLENQLNRSLSIFPIPLNQDILNIEVTKESFRVLQIEILSLQGHKILTSKRELLDGVQTLQMDLSALAAGMYLVAIHGNSGEKIIRKIIKTN